MKRATRKSPRFVVSVRNGGYPESLELRKLYRVMPDAKALRVGMIRVVDESREDYLYPLNFFAPVKLDADVTRAFVAA